MAKHHDDHDDLADSGDDVAIRPSRRGRHNEETSQFLCENCGYIGTAERVEDCPNCGYRMLALDEFGNFEEDDDLLGHFDEAEDEVTRAAGNPDSLEDLKDDEFDEFDDEEK